MPGPPQLGRVFWSAAAQQFYQEGRVGALGRLEGMSYLTFRTTQWGERLIDQRGQFVPNIENLIPDRLFNQFVDRLREGRLTLRDVYTERAAKGNYFATIATWEDADRRLHVTEKFYKGGSAINNELELRQLQAQVGSDLGLERSEWYTAETADMVRAMFHYEMS